MSSVRELIDSTVSRLRSRLGVECDWNECDELVAHEMADYCADHQEKVEEGAKRAFCIAAENGRWP